MSTYVVNTITHRKTGLLVATSADLPGLLVHGRTNDELEERIPIAIKALLEAAGETVGEFYKVEDDGLPDSFQPSNVRYAADAMAA